MPLLADHLSPTSTLWQCETALLLKAFFSPDELFRPIRAALKHNIFSSPAAVLSDALARSVRPDADAFDAASGWRLQQEHQLLPDMNECAPRCNLPSRTHTPKCERRVRTFAREPFD